MQEVVNGYYDWLKEKTLIKQVGGFAEITTPFLDRHNDCIQLYMQLQKDGGYYVSDDGYTISDLQMCGIDVTTPKRKKLLNNILTSYGLEISKDFEIFTKCTEKDIYVKKHFFIQAILDINNLCFTSRSTVVGIFTEEVESYLENNNIRFMADMQFVGKSGLPRRFDFAIPKSKKSNERYVQLANTVNKQTTDKILFAWEDVKYTRNNAQLIVMLNDQKQKIGTDLIQAYQSYDIYPMLWTEREDKENINILVS